MNTEEFIELVYEIAFGDNAINRDFTHHEVLNELRKFSDEALLREGDNNSRILNEMNKQRGMTRE
tara:strand:+ start:56 stop:250 length:195 start_codon:yes stop_codon:yes gene_type:complete